MRQAPEQRRWPVGEERIVSGEQLVAAVARERDLHAPPGEAGQEQRGQEARIRERLVERGNRLRQQIEARVPGESLGRVLRPQAPRGELRIGRLVEALLGESDRERLQRILVARGQRGDRRRIDPAREKDSDRNVRDEPPRHRAIEQPDQLLSGLARRNWFFRRSGELPVPPQAKAALVEHCNVRGRQLEDVAMDAARGRYVLDREVLRERLVVQLPRHSPVRRERFQLRAEDSARRGAVRSRRPRSPFSERVVQRLLAEPIARQDQLAPWRVPERDGEHPAGPLPCRCGW